MKCTLSIIFLLAKKIPLIFFLVLFSNKKEQKYFKIVRCQCCTPAFFFLVFHFKIFVEKRRKNFFCIKKVFLEKFRVHLFSSTSKAGGLSIKMSQGLVPKLKRWNTLAFWREGARVIFFSESRNWSIFVGGGVKKFRGEGRRYLKIFLCVKYTQLFLK